MKLLVIFAAVLLSTATTAKVPQVPTEDTKVIAQIPLLTPIVNENGGDEVTVVEAHVVEVKPNHVQTVDESVTEMPKQTEVNTVQDTTTEMRTVAVETTTEMNPVAVDTTTQTAIRDPLARRLLLRKTREVMDEKMDNANVEDNVQNKDVVVIDEVTVVVAVTPGLEAITEVPVQMDETTVQEIVTESPVNKENLNEMQPLPSTEDDVMKATKTPMMKNARSRKARAVVEDNTVNTMKSNVPDTNTVPVVEISTMLVNNPGVSHEESVTVVPVPIEVTTMHNIVTELPTGPVTTPAVNGENDVVKVPLTKAPRMRMMRAINAEMPAVTTMPTMIDTKMTSMEAQPKMVDTDHSTIIPNQPQKPSNACDMECTKFDLNPVCAFNGVCVYEFPNQCILDTFNCVHPDVGFKATKDDRCLMHWLVHCTEKDLMG